MGIWGLVLGLLAEAALVLIVWIFAILLLEWLEKGDD